MALEGEAVGEEVLRHQAALDGRVVREDAVGAGEEGGEEDEDVEEVVEGGFGVELPGGAEPFRGGEEAGFAVE